MTKKSEMLIQADSVPAASSEKVTRPDQWWAEKRDDGRWQVQMAHRGAGSSFCVAQINHLADDAEALARLISSAPDMHRAIAQILLYAPDIGVDQFRQGLALARAALTKAGTKVSYSYTWEDDENEGLPTDEQIEEMAASQGGQVNFSDESERSV